MTLTNADRAGLRRLIAAHPNWPEYRRTHGVDTSSLGAARALDAARHLGIDVSAFGTHNQIQDNQTMTQTPTAPAGLFNRRQSVQSAPVAPSVQSAMDALLAALSAQQGDGAALDNLAARVEVLENASPRLLVIDTNQQPIGPSIAGGHRLLPDLIRKLSCRKLDGTRLNVWMTGPAGSGKTYACAQAATALGLDFAYHGSMTQAYELLGFVDAGGTYRESHFVRCYRDGGLCLLDEVDSGSDEARLAINGALSGSLMSLPNGEMVKRHTDFACVAAANTWGHGATSEYVGRTKVDGAFLDRFVALPWGYDEKAEYDMAGPDVSDWVDHVQAARKKAAALGLKVLITPRASIDGGAMIRAGFTIAETAEATYAARLSPEQKSALGGI